MKNHSNLKTPLIVLAAVLLFIVAIFAWRNYIHPSVFKTECGTYAEEPMTIAGKRISVLVADDDCKKTLGLSGNAGLPKDTGMLFPFSAPGKYGFWMQDMRYPLDIIWISADLSVVGVEKGLSPDTYPQIFGQNWTAEYVLEVPAGFSDENGVAVGQKISFE